MSRLLAEDSDSNGDRSRNEDVQWSCAVYSVSEMDDEDS